MQKIILVFCFAIAMNSISSAEELKGMQFVVEGYVDAISVLEEQQENRERKNVLEKYWVQKKKVKVEAEESINIQTEQAVYECNSKRKICHKSPINYALNVTFPHLEIGSDSVLTIIGPKSFGNVTEKGAKLIGTEDLHGYPCDVYIEEYKKDDAKWFLFDGGGYIKYWVWKKNNLLLKVESSMQSNPIFEPKHSRNFLFETKDIKLNIDVDDKLFEPPGGYAVYEGINKIK